MKMVAYPVRRSFDIVQAGNPGRQAKWRCSGELVFAAFFENTHIPEKSFGSRMAWLNGFMSFISNGGGRQSAATRNTFPLCLVKFPEIRPEIIRQRIQERIV